MLSLCVGKWHTWMFALGRYKCNRIPFYLLYSWVKWHTVHTINSSMPSDTYMLTLGEHILEFREHSLVFTPWTYSLQQKPKESPYPSGAYWPSKVLIQFGLPQNPITVPCGLWTVWQWTTVDCSGTPTGSSTEYKSWALNMWQFRINLPWKQIRSNGEQ